MCHMPRTNLCSAESIDSALYFSIFGMMLQTPGDLLS